MQITLNRMKFDVNQLAELNRLLPTTMSIQSEVANLLSNFQAGPMAAEMRSTLPSLAPLDEQMSLLLQHSNRWRRFHIFAVQPTFIHHTMHRIGGVPRSVPLLRQFSVQVSTMECDPTDLAPELGGDLPFDGIVPSLQSLTLCYGYLPVQFFPLSNVPLLRTILPELKELELSKDIQLDHSLWLGILRVSRIYKF